MNTPTNVPPLMQRWQEYKDAVYPEEIPAIQNRECHQAFFAGALSMISLMKKISAELPEDEAAKAVEQLFREASTTCGLHAFAMKYQS